MNDYTNYSLRYWLEEKDLFQKRSTKQAYLRKESEDKVLALFHKASKEVPAYKKFLESHGIKPSQIKTFPDFKKIPVMTKENYIDAFSLEERCWDGNLSKMSMISSSSGTTSTPHYWPRDISNEIDGARAHEFLLQYVCNTQKYKTLFINGFAMGNWIAGTFTYASLNLLILKGYSVTVMTPGYSLEGVVDCLHHIASYFEQVVITGHMPFLKEIVETINQDSYNYNRIILLGTGQAITEGLREYLIAKLRTKSNSAVVYNLYGSADAALMGFETPEVIQYRKFVSNNTPLTKKLFKRDSLPSLYVYDPRLTFFESIEGELIITKNMGCPLIRYNIHDEGGIYSSSDFRSFFENKIKLKSQNEFPFVYLYGRDKFMVKIYGANIYSEHAQYALSHETLQPKITGQYLMETLYNKNNDPELVCRIEVNPEVVPSDDLANLISKIFVQEVRKINREYNDVLGRMGEKVEPKIILHEYGHPVYFPKGKVKKNA